MVARAYEHGKALNVATYFEIDDVIDPVDSRARILSALRSAPPPRAPHGQEAPDDRHLVTLCLRRHPPLRFGWLLLAALDNRCSAETAAALRRP